MRPANKLNKNKNKCPIEMHLKCLSYFVQFAFFSVSIGLIVLIVFVSLFIAVPLLILLLQRTEANKKDEVSSCVPHGMHSPLLRKRKKTSLSINRCDVDEDSFPGMSA